MSENTQIVILAAGKGSRMGGDIPKALTPLGKKTMIEYVIDTVQSFTKNKPITVIGYKGNLIKKIIGDKSIYSFQDVQKGTGHAVLTAKDLLENDTNIDTIIILYADQPFISPSTLKKLSNKKNAKNSKIVIATAIIEDKDLFQRQFYNFGRVIRGNDGTITKIVEKKDATDNELLTREVNPAYFCLDKRWMLDNLGKLKNNNAQGEYYLTDLVQIAFGDGLNIESVSIEEKEALGANTPEQLEILKKYLNK